MPAMCSASVTLTAGGRLKIRISSTVTRLNTITNICFTSVQATAWTPPNMVYSAVVSPINRQVVTMLVPMITESTTDGAERIAPHDIAREIRNRNAVKDRVFASKRRSRYSYAVKTFAPWKNGTSVADRISIASGKA